MHGNLGFTYNEKPKVEWLSGLDSTSLVTRVIGLWQTNIRNKTKDLLRLIFPVPSLAEHSRDKAAEPDAERGDGPDGNEGGAVAKDPRPGAAAAGPSEPCPGALPGHAHEEGPVLHLRGCGGEGAMFPRRVSSFGILEYKIVWWGDANE